MPKSKNNKKPWTDKDKENLLASVDIGDPTTAWLNNAFDRNLTPKSWAATILRFKKQANLKKSTSEIEIKPIEKATPDLIGKWARFTKGNGTGECFTAGRSYQITKIMPTVHNHYVFVTNDHGTQSGIYCHVLYLVDPPPSEIGSEIKPKSTEETHPETLPRKHDGVCDHCGQDVGDCPGLMDDKWVCIDCIHGRLEEYDDMAQAMTTQNKEVERLQEDLYLAEARLKFSVSHRFLKMISQLDLSSGTNALMTAQELVMGYDPRKKDV